MRDISIVTHRLTVTDLMTHGVSNSWFNNLIMMNCSGVNLNLDISSILNNSLFLSVGLSGHSLVGDSVDGGLLLHLVLLVHLFLLLLLLPQLSLHLGPEVVDHLLLVVPVHVEERSWGVVSGSEIFEN